ncbi:YadA-like family protein [Veillonella sp. VA141]|uniref:YadA-like family protein n=1 Tax=Veillonella sp. VA141 TaxID=741833 RepID=UPI000F8DBC7A|nr:YadA-like family protein [Veillonella sp. VA141]
MKNRTEIVRMNAAHAQGQQKVNRLAAMAAILGVTAFSVAGMTTIFAVDNAVGTGEGTAIGTSSNAVKEGSIALGNKAVTNAEGGVAIGKATLAGAGPHVIAPSNAPKNTVAIGTNAYASHTDTVVIGTGATSLRDNQNVTRQSGSEAVAIGKQASSHWDKAVAIGSESRTNMSQSVAIGYQAESTARAMRSAGAVAIGPVAKALGGGSSVIGNNAQGVGNYTTVVGTEALAHDTNGTTVGNQASTRKDNDTAIGALAGTGVKAGRAVAVGYGSHVAETSGMAVGDRAVSFTAGGLALGRTSTTYGSQAISIGNGSATKGNAGENTFAAGTGAISVGTTARAMGLYGFAFGNESVAGGDATLAAKVSTALQTYQGAYNTYLAKQDESLKAKSDMEASKQRLAGDARDFGLTVYSLTADEVQLAKALGIDYDAMKAAFFDGVKVDNDYASGKEAVTGNLAALEKIAALDPKTASNTKVDITRLIKRAKDLVDLNKKDDTNKEKATIAAAAATAEEATLETAKTTLKDAYASAKESALAVGTKAVAEGKNSVAIGRESNAKNENSVAIGTQSKSLADHGVAIGVKAQATVDNGVGLGSYSVADIEARKGYDVNENHLNTYAGLKGNTLTSGTAAVAVGTPRMTRQITYVAAGTDDTDAVNVAQLRSINLRIAGDTVANVSPVEDGVSKADVLLDNQTLKVVSANKDVLTTDATNNTITIKPVTAKLKKDPNTGLVTLEDPTKGNALTTAQNVADMINNAAPKIGNGLTNGDGTIVVKPADKSINVSDAGVKVNADGTTITVGDNGLQVNTGAITVNDKDGKGADDKPVNAGTVSVKDTDKGKIATVDTVVNAINNAAWNVTSGEDGTGKAEGTTKEAVKAGNTVTLKAGNNLKLKQVGKEFTYSLNPELKDLTSASFINTAGDTTTVINAEGMTITPKAADKNPVSLTTTGLNNGNNKITNVKAGEKDTDAVNVSQLTGVKNDVKNLKDELEQHINSSGFSITSDIEDGGKKADDTTTSTEEVKDGNKVTLKAGANLKIKQKGTNFTYSLNPELTGITSIAGEGDTAGKVTFGDNGVVTVGTPGAANAISLDGKDGKISMGKVSLSKEGLDNGGKKITNVAPGEADTDAVNVSQLRDAAGNMQEITNQLQGQVNRVGSQAAALSALKPIQYDPLEPTQIMAGVGHYQGQNSLALGVAHYKNESLMFHAGAAIGGNHSQVMANAGITWKVGSKADETAVADVYRQGPISSAYVLQDKMGALEAQNLEQKGEINALREENKSQRAELDAVKAQLATVLSRLQG